MPWHEPTRHRCGKPSKTSTASRCHITNVSPPSQAASWKRSRHGGIVRSSRSIHLLSSTASGVSLRTEYGVQQVGQFMSCLPMTSTGCKDVLGPRINETESKHARMHLRRAAVAALRSWHPVHGWRERIGGRRQGCIPACHGSALHRTLIRNSIRYIPRKQVECIHEAA